MARTRSVKKPTTTAPKNPPAAKVVQVQFIISVGKDDTRSIEELRNDIKAALLEQTGAKMVTPVSGYYLVNGRVCLEDDYDPETCDFKPGRHSPLWAMAPDERDIIARIEREKKRDALSRNPTGLRTAEESKRFRQQQEVQSRLDKPGAAMADFYENTERGREIVAEREAALKKAHTVESDDVDWAEDVEWEDEGSDEGDEIIGYDEDGPDDVVDDDTDWDVDDINDDEKMDAALDDVTESMMDKLRSNPKRKVIRK